MKIMTINCDKNFKIKISAVLLLVNNCFSQEFQSTSSYNASNVVNDFIFQYFTYKSPKIVVGFTCNDDYGDFNLAKKFSESQVSTIFHNLEEQKLRVLDVFKAKYSRIGVLIDARCQTIDMVKLTLAEATNARLFDELHYWLIITSTSDSMQLINDDAFGLSTDFVVAQFSEDAFKLYDTYNPCKRRGGNLKITMLGRWDGNSGLKLYSHYQSKTYRWNLHGMKLLTRGLTPNVSEVFLMNYDSKTEEPTAKLAFALWKPISEKYNFTIDYLPNSTWLKGDRNGPVVTALDTGEIDISGTPVTLNHDRLRVAIPVYPAVPFRSFFLFRSSSFQRININEIFQPLQPTVWYLIIAVGIASINVLALLSIYTPIELYEKYVRSFLITVGAFCQQGTNFDFDYLSGRIAILHIFIGSLLIYNYYLASVVSTRVNEPIIKINDSLNELRKTEFTFATQYFIFFDFYMQRNDWDTRTFFYNLWSKIPEHKKIMDPNEGMGKVQQGRFAYHTIPEIGYTYAGRYFDDRQICELTEVHLVHPTLLSFFVERNSSFVEMLRTGFAWLSEIGIRDRQIKRWTIPKPQCRKDILTAQSVTIHEIVAGTVFLLVSFLVSGVILTIEVFYSNNKS